MRPPPPERAHLHAQVPRHTALAGDGLSALASLATHPDLHPALLPCVPAVVDVLARCPAGMVVAPSLLLLARLAVTPQSVHQIRGAGVRRVVARTVKNRSYGPDTVANAQTLLRVLV